MEFLSQNPLSLKNRIRFVLVAWGLGDYRNTGLMLFCGRTGDFPGLSPSPGDEAVFITPAPSKSKARVQKALEWIKGPFANRKAP